MKTLTIILFLGLTFFAGQEVQAMRMANVHSFTVETIDGERKNLADYKGQVLLIVNTASKCGFTKQYKPLETLYQTYRDRGFVVLAFPSNDFMGQEPGSNAEIKQFCEIKYKTTFPVFAKTSVKGKDINPLYQYLTQSSSFPGEISWNFNKILVNAEGDVVVRFGSSTDPLDKALIAELEKVLPAK